MLELLKVALGAFLGAIAAFSVQWIKTARDERRQLSDEFCKNVSDAADLATTYWRTQPTADQIGLQEDRLLGLQRRIDGYRVLVQRDFDPHNSERLQSAVADLFDAITGGEFGEAGRHADHNRSLASQVKASDLILAIREGHASSATAGQTMRRACKPVLQFAGSQANEIQSRTQQLLHKFRGRDPLR